MDVHSAVGLSDTNPVFTVDAVAPVVLIPGTAVPRVANHGAVNAVQCEGGIVTALLGSSGGHRIIEVAGNSDRTAAIP